MLARGGQPSSRTGRCVTAHRIADETDELRACLKEGRLAEPTDGAPELNAAQEIEAGLDEPEVRDLAELAAELAGLPAAAPRRAWPIESKWRLLRAFDERRSPPRPRSDQAGSQGSP